VLEQFLDRVGNWNPQFGRELKTRINLPNLAISTAISLLTQVLTLILPDPRVLEFNNHKWYITPYWWLNICELLDREILLVLAVGGIYLLAKDFDRESRTGTLALVNLSPAQPWEILLGKLLGVPILIYWAVFLALPLHVISVLQIAAIAPHAWVGDLISLSQIGLLYLYALLATMRFRLPPIALSLLLSAMGGLSLVSINKFLITRHLSGSYSDLGIYLPEDWSIIWKVCVTFAINYIVLCKLLQFWYLRSNTNGSRRSYQSYGMLPLYLCSLFFPLLLVKSELFGIFFFAIIAVNIAIKATEVN
jgi:hypothetical protein